MSKTIVARTAWIVGVFCAALALSGCATDKGVAENWTGGDPSKLEADQIGCHKDAADLDVNQAANYSDGQYGLASAMAAAVSSNEPLSDQGPAIRRAAFDTCMTGKGWKLQ